jgi:putative glutamine amidotransferase
MSTPHERTGGWREDRDAWELSLLSAAEATGLPVLGVCRGMQLMAVHAGGSLHQHTPDLVGHDEHSPGGASYGLIEVHTQDDTLLQAIVGRSVSVPCHHHQSVADHPGFQAVAHAADGTLEAMERSGPRFCVAVQWHPEAGHDDSLFRALVNAAISD